MVYTRAAKLVAAKTAMMEQQWIKLLGFGWIVWMVALSVGCWIACWFACWGYKRLIRWLDKLADWLVLDLADAMVDLKEKKAANLVGELVVLWVVS